MKKAFLLTEVIVSIVLIFGVVFALFEIKNNSFNIMTRMKSNEILNSAISIVGINNKETDIQNDTIYLKDVVNFNEDRLKESFKDIRVKQKKEEQDSQNVLFPNSSVEVTVFQTSLQIDKKMKKNIYTIKFD